MTSPDWKRGYVHVYTGNGKGKTTAALGLALRAAGAGMRVFIGQFAKGMDYSELRALDRFQDLITVRQYGRAAFVPEIPAPQDIQAAGAGVQEVRQLLRRGPHRLVILDEANFAVARGLIPVHALLDMISAKPEDVELVITGRDADPRVIAAADLVTEMREVKHYYAQGVSGRRGIEK